MWPEKVSERANVLQGRIVHEVERGLDYVLFVSIGEGGDRGKYDLEIQVSDHLHYLMALKVGKEIFLSLPPDRLHLLAPDE